MSDNPSFAAPAWSLELGQLGRILVVLSTLLFAASALAYILGARSSRAQAIGKHGFTLGAFGLFSTFAVLATLFVADRYEYAYVWQHSDTRNTIPYRIAGVWSGQQGSFLLWGVAAAIFGLLVVGGTGQYRRWFTASYAVFLGAISGILAYESPFTLNLVDGQVVVPSDGLGLNPSLQNYWVIIHPPTIFLGFGSLTVLFALALAAMLEKDTSSWIPIVRPWSIVSLTLVGLGLCMGGFWAYETLGWGGFWMWDPVENTSFVPWCFCATFTHGIIVQAVKKKWKLANLMFGGLPFLTFVYGTFLTRSGFLADASVHSFAEMNSSALKVLIGLMALMTIGFASVWFVRYFQARSEPLAEPEASAAPDREGYYKVGAFLLIGLGVATLIGMSVPLFMALQGKKPSVIEEHAYHLVLVWLFIPLLVVMALAPFVSWRGTGIKEIIRRTYSIACLAIAAVGLLLFSMVASNMGSLADLTSTVGFPGGLQVRGLGWILFLLGLCAFGLIAACWRAYELRSAAKLALAPFISHLGITILMAGLIVSRGLERKEQVLVSEEGVAQTSNYLLRYAGQTSTRTDRDNKVRIEVYDLQNVNTPLYVATPGLYYIDRGEGEPQAMTWPHIKHSAIYDTYLALQAPQRQASDSMSINPGEQKVLGGAAIKYLEPTRVGEPGQPGTKFGAKLQVEIGGHREILNPTIELGSNGPTLYPATLRDGTLLSITRIDAGTKAVTFEFESPSEVFPIEVFHKPFVGLVWLGAGVLAAGGFLSALYRRRTRPTEKPVAARAQHSRKKVLVHS